MLKRIIVKLLHPLLLSILKLQAKHKFVFLNERPIIAKNTIYVFNHGTSNDVPYTGIIIKKHSYIVGGKQNERFIDKLFSNLNGTIWIDRKDKADKKRGSKEMLKVLLRGDSLCIFPEATWNIIPSLPMLPMAWGVIDLSIKSGRPIMPIVIDYDSKNCYVNFGNPMHCKEGDDKAEKIADLRDEMATRRWEIWERYFKADRKDVSPDEWEKEVKARVEAYPPLDFEYEKSCIRKLPNTTEPHEAFAHLDSLIPCKENAFLFNKRWLSSI